MQFSLDTVQAVARLLRECDLAEISLQTVDGDVPSSRLTLRRAALAPHSLEAPALDEISGTAEAPDTAAEVLQANASGEAAPAAMLTEIIVAARAVGIFRHAAPPVRVGSVVRSGDVVAVVESLRVPNEVHAPAAGRVALLLVEEGQGVEYGQPLMVLEPPA